MKNTKENEKFRELGEKTVELIKIAYPNVVISYTWNEKTEVFTFVIDGKEYDVYCVYSSVRAGLRDIANQLLTEDF